MKKHKRYEIYQSDDGWHRWRLIGKNEEIMASGEPHPSAELARRAINRVKRSVLAPIVVRE